MENKLLKASFEQSKRIVKKEILTREGAQIGISSSMSFWTRVSGLIALAFSFIMYGIGIYLPDNLRESTEGVQVISESTGILIGEIGLYLRPLIFAVVILFSALIILDIFPKINYAYQLLYGNTFVVISAIAMLIASLPLTIGLTIGAFGVLAFVVQLLVSVYLFKIMIVDQMKQLKNSIYNENELESKDWGTPLMNFIKKYGGIFKIKKDEETGTESYQKIANASDNVIIHNEDITTSDKSKLDLKYYKTLIEKNMFKERRASNCMELEMIKKQPIITGKELNKLTEKMKKEKNQMKLF